MEIMQEFSGGKNAKIASGLICASVSKIKGVKISHKVKGTKVAINICNFGDETKQLAAYYTAKRLLQMLGQIDGQV